jgi:Cu-processing system permease protein
MTKIVLIAWITFKDSIRNKALYGIFLLGIIMLAASIIITGMFSWELGKVAVDISLSVISFSGLILIFFFSIHMVSNDIEKRTVYLILSRPITKAHYILGKYMGLSLIILLSSFLLGICATLSVKISTMGGAGFMPAHFSWNLFFLSIAFLTVSLLVMTAISILLVTITSHPFTAVLLAIMTYFIGQNIENVKNIIISTEIFPPDAISMTVINIVSWLLPNLAVFDLKTTAAYGLPINPISLTWSLVYGLSYSAMCMIAAILIFQRRELA